jgi:hypothetical protein
MLLDYNSELVFPLVRSFDVNYDWLVVNFQWFLWIYLTVGIGKWSRSG